MRWAATRMYGWWWRVLGLALGTGSAWLLAGWIVAVRALDREIDIEESRLRARFGPAYDAYLDAVPRYLALPSADPDYCSRRGGPRRQGGREGADGDHVVPLPISAAR